MKKTLILLLLLSSSLTILLATPLWVSSYGTRSSYSPDLFLTGFAMINKYESDSLIKVKELALSDLTGKIETKIFSEIVLSESDGTEGYSSTASMVTQSTVNITVFGVEYEIYGENNKYYALSYIATEDLLESYIQKSSDSWISMQRLYENSLSFRSAGNSVKALSELYRAQMEISGFMENYSLYNSINLDSEDDSFFESIGEMDSFSDFRDLENKISAGLEELENLKCRNLAEAMGKIALILKRQDIRGGNIDIPSSTYKSTSFSSPFGRYASAGLESSIINTLERSTDKTIIRSNYWQEGDLVFFRVLVLNESGEKLGQAVVKFPTSSVSYSYDLKPQNFNEAMVALKEFADGALTDGGLNVDIWTNKGRNRDSPVYEEGESLSLYMRVNQPAFLQITYILATGQKVLLEPSFYIGLDQVNRAVKLPYEFEVISPLGIEQLVVTAFSAEPPVPVTVLELIDGEQYEVFTSMKAVVAQTRGLRKKVNNTEEIRVGEAIVNLTTIGKE